MTHDLVEHLERHLGPLDAGWKPRGEADEGIRVVRFADQPEPGVTTYVTLGLSRRPLPMPGGRQVRQELLFVADDRAPAEQVASFLMTFAEWVAGRGRALLRGDVVGPGPSLIPEVACDSIYAAIPVLHEDGLATFPGSEPPTVIVWAMPLRRSEAELVRERGWESFEDLLERRPPDFADLDRPAVA